MECEESAAGSSWRYFLCGFKSGGWFRTGRHPPGSLLYRNEMGNKHSPTVICAAITSRMHKSKLPTHVEIDARRYGVVKNSVVLLEQIRTIDKQRLKESVCHLDQEIMKKVDEALKISIALST